MPIVLPPEKGRPLEQGDILKGVALAATVAPAWSVSTKIAAEYVLVVSRPCKAIRAEHVVVAPVTTFALDLVTLGERLEEAAKQKAKDGKESAPKRATLDRLRRYLQGIRDGGDVSDSFYLGSLKPEKPGQRYAALLSSLFTIVLPEGETEDKRKALIESCRVARLNDAYLRDLHMRLHLTFGRLGFDDHDWYTERDLSEMILAGEAELTERKKDLQDAQMSANAAEAKGDDVSKRAAELAKKQEAVAEAERALLPFKEEQTKREAVRASQAPLPAIPPEEDSANELASSPASTDEES